MLTPEQVQFYRDNGYIVASNVLSKDEVSALQKVTDDFIEQSRRVTVSDKVFDLEDGHTPERPRLRRLMNPERRHPLYESLFRHPGLLAVLQQLLGPSVRHKGLKMNLKPGGGGEPVEWHQDWAYYPHTNDDLLVLAIMLDDVTMENGPMLVVPGTHKGPIYNHHQDGIFAGAVTDPTAEEAYKRAVPVLGKAGDISMHHTRTLHGSSSNLSDRYRRLLFITAAAADAWPLAEKVDLDAFNARMLVGEPTLEPRLTSVPVRIPYPRLTQPGESIFVKQKGLRNSPFQRVTKEAAMMDA
jgi:ectoine hydroxylase-related dioxygenase (phytanoyl-CoA dioxygenase family)